MIEFQKFHGTGNDFIIFEEDKINIKDYVKLAKKVCNRHFGVGADGMIIVSDSINADIRMKFYNADGSIASMCGNGIRCFAKFVYENKLVNEKSFTVETLAGIMKVEVIVESGELNLVKVNLGRAVFLSNEIPIGKKNKYFIDEEINLDGTKLKISSLVVGTIHTIVFVNDFNEIDIKAIGQAIEQNKIFPVKTNVNFCKVIDCENIEVITWEKGVGITLSCGTGAASSAVISSILKGCNKKINVKALGGKLIIEQNGDEIFIIGPVEQICSGEYNYI